MAKRINALAQRIEHDPFFLGSALAEYARSEHMDDKALAAALGCPAESLGPLRLCRRPRPDPVQFRSDIMAIAARFGVNAEVLAEAVRRAVTLTRLRQSAVDGQGLLMAARDRNDDPHDPDAPEGMQ